MAKVTAVPHYTTEDQRRSVPLIQDMRAFVASKACAGSDAMDEAYGGVSRALAAAQDAIPMAWLVDTYRERRARALIDDFGREAWTAGVDMARHVSPWLDGEIRRLV